MPIFAPGVWAGINRSMEIDRERALEQSRLTGERQKQQRDAWEFQAAQEDRQRQMRARSGAGQSLYGMVPPPVPQPPMPGQGSQPMQPPGMTPGVGAGQPPQMFSQPPAMPPGGPAAPQRGAPTPAPIPPYRAVPQPGQQPPQPGPQAAPQGPPPVGASPPQPQGGLLMQMATKAKAAGVRPEDFMDQIDALAPVLKNQISEEMMQLRGTMAEQSAYFKGAMLALSGRREDNREGEATRRGDQADRRLGQGDQRITIALDREGDRKAAGIKGWKEFRGGDGTIYRDNVNAGLTQKKVDGKWVDVDSGLPEDAKPANTSSSSATNVRQGIVKAGVTNALARLNEIDKKFGDKTTTSSLFGKHADGPVTESAYGVARGMQGRQQQEADAAWGSFIDEAIPVFTGGLRGSDSFRQFLMGQAPRPGDKPEVVKEKKRLLRENINGTSRAFFNKYKSDPTMWAPGEKPDDSGAAPSAAGKGGWKVERAD